jgi:hypothetical protein
MTEKTEEKAEADIKALAKALRVPRPPAEETPVKPKPQA